MASTRRDYTNVPAVDLDDDDDLIDPDDGMSHSTSLFYPNKPKPPLNKEY